MARLGFWMVAGCVMVSSISPSFAGFEFSGARERAPAPMPSPAPVVIDTNPNAPMPIVPSIPVTSEPLSPPVRDTVLPNAVSRADQTYIRRQRPTNILAPAPNEAIDTAGLLEATTQGAEVYSANQVMPSASSNNPLYINPYPLQKAPQNTVRSRQVMPVDQAMMEQAGRLRPVALPGGERPGMIARGQNTARYDSGSPYLERGDTMNPPVFDDAMMGLAMTPIPGGEAPPLDPPAMQKPRPPSVMGGYTEAVGFGRDLPLALALSQVIPLNYSYAFATDIDAGVNVSWQGGKPWDVVLNDMLAPSGLLAVIENNQVFIRTL